MSNRFWIVALTAFFLLCALAALVIWRMPGERTVAQISVDGEVVRTIDLSAVTGEQTFVIETRAGNNTIAARPGWLEGGAVPIVCLPHRLVISLTSGGSEDALDAVSG